MKEGKVKLSNKYDDPKLKAAPATRPSAPPVPAAAATEKPKRLSRSKSAFAKRRADRSFSAAGETVSDDDLCEFCCTSICRNWAAGLGCQGGESCPGLQCLPVPVAEWRQNMTKVFTTCVTSASKTYPDALNRTLAALMVAEAIDRTWLGQ